jgi:hypothetical protein
MCKNPETVGCEWERKGEARACTREGPGREKPSPEALGVGGAWRGVARGEVPGGAVNDWPFMPFLLRSKPSDSKSKFHVPSKRHVVWKNKSTCEWGGIAVYRALTRDHNTSTAPAPTFVRRFSVIALRASPPRLASPHLTS